MNKTHGHGSTDFEVSGYLQKKTSKGLFMHRYFATKSHYLHYWTDKKSYENEEKPSETFDLCEITNMSRINSKQFILCFMSDKFKLELKAPSSELCVEWKEILAAKRALYSVNDLMTNLEIDHASFVTKTFQSLMILKERDQNEYIMERLDDIFLAAEDEAKSKMLRSDSFALVNAATVCFQELILTCEECNLEISQRNPRITAHCRLYIQRYAEIVKGRVTLELLYLPGIQQKKYELMGMPTICAAVKFMSVVSKIPSFSFVPHDIVPAIHSNLFTTGQLISALINISITKMDSLFVKLEEIALGQRNKVLELVDHTVSEVLSTIPMDTFDGENANLVYNKVFTCEISSHRFCNSNLFNRY